MSKSKDPVTGKRLTGRQLIAQEIAEYRRDAKLDSWNSFVEELHAPVDLQPALMVGRSELIRLCQPRALTAEEAAVLYKIIAGLMDTNAALRQHTARVAGLTVRLNDALKGFDSAARSIEDFASFRVSEDESEDEEAA